MSQKKLASPLTLFKGRQTDIRVIQKFDYFTNTNEKCQKSNVCKHQLTHQSTGTTNETRINTGNKNQNTRHNGEKEKIIAKLLEENTKLKEQNQKKNQLIEMLIDERTDIRRVTSLHFPSDREIQQSKTSHRLGSPNSMEFTFYKSPSKQLPKEFQITPSKKMFF